MFTTLGAIFFLEKIKTSTVAYMYNMYRKRNQGWNKTTIIKLKL